MKKQLLLLIALVVTLSAASVWAYTWDGIDFHGFLGQGYMISNGNNFLGGTKDGTFHMTEMAFNASKQINDHLRVGGQLYAFREGELGPLNQPQIDWLYVDYSYKDWLGFRLGKVKTPGPLYNEALDLDMSRPFVLLPQGVYPATWRDFNAGIWAAEAYGNVELKKYGSLDYTFLIGKHKVKSTAGFLENLSATTMENADNFRENYSVIGQLIWNTPAKGLRINGTAGYANHSTCRGTFKTADELSALPPPLGSLSFLGGSFGGGAMREIQPSVFYWTVGSEYLMNKWTFSAEYWTLMTKAFTYIDGHTGGGSLDGGLAKFIREDAFYLSASYQLNKKTQIGAYYSLAYNNVHDRDGTDESAIGGQGYSQFQKDLALSLRYDLTPYWLITAEGHVINGTGELFVNQNEPWQHMDRYWLMGIVKTTLYF